MFPTSALFVTSNLQFSLLGVCRARSIHPERSPGLCPVTYSWSPLSLPGTLTPSSPLHPPLFSPPLAYTLKSKSEGENNLAPWQKKSLSKFSKLLPQWISKINIYYLWIKSRSKKKKKKKEFPSMEHPQSSSLILWKPVPHVPFLSVDPVDSWWWSAG